MATASRHLSISLEGKTQKAKISKENLKQALILFKYLKPHRGKFILGLVFIALTAFSTSLFPLFLGKMIDAASFTLAEFLRGIFMLIIGLFFIFLISTKLALVMLAVVPLLAIAAVIFGKSIRKRARKTQDHLAESSTIVQETFHGISIVKAFTSEFHEVTRYVKSLKAVVSTAISNARYRGAFVAFMIFSLFGTMAFVIWYGGRLIQSGELTIGVLVTFVIFSGFVGGTFAGFADMFSQLQKTLGATQSVREILHSEGEPVELKPIEVEPEYELKGNVRFDHVAFCYPSRKDITVLNDLCLAASNGEQIAIVGPSGAGKSTIASLLLHFYEPDSGTLYFDERPAREFPLSQLRRQMAFVPQEVILFGGSIKENIAYGKPEATDEEIIAAAKSANAHEFVSSFPEQYETIVGERGIKLSGGQRQRIAIARAIFT